MITRRQFNKISALGVVGLSSPGILSSNLMQGGKIRIGQIGTAHSHAETKIETVRKLNDVFYLVGVVERDQLKRKEAEQKPAYQGVTWLTEADLFNYQDLQAVLVETDIDDLVPIALRCVNAGLHVHIDKPPGKSYSDFTQLTEVAQKKDLIIQIGYMFRYNPAFRFCLKAVREGWLGDIFEVDGVISKVIKANRRPKLATTYGGGMMLLGCHLIDILIAILGESDSMQSFREQTFSQSDGLYDNELVIVKHKKAISSIRSSLVEVEGQKRRQFVVCGTKGTIEIKPLEPPRLQMALNKSVGKYKKGYQSINLKKMPGRYDDQLRDFARMIKGEKKPDFSLEHDLLVHKTLLEACGFLANERQSSF
jgi:predicted dehydrogenase